MRKRTALIFALFVSLNAYIEAFAKEKWLIAEVENLSVHSDAYEYKARKIVDELLKVQHAFTTIFPMFEATKHRKIRVYIFRSKTSLKRFTPLYGGKPKDVAGLFTQDSEGDLIVIDASGNFQFKPETVYHEYIHYLMRANRLYMPLWLDEGIAEVFSTISFSKKGIQIGRVHKPSLFWLNQKKPIAFDRFFRVRHNSPEYNDINHGQGIFYAQSWLVVHYLMFGQHDLPPNAFQMLLKEITERPTLTDERLKDLFGFGLEELEQRLIDYRSKGRTYEYHQYPIIGIEQPEYTFSKATQGEIDLIKGTLLLKMREPEDAYPHIARAIDKMPQSAQARSYMGYYLLEQELWNQAAEELKAATELGDASASAYLYYAIARINAMHLASAVNSKPLNKEQSIDLLSFLFKALERGESRMVLYTSISEVWAYSQMIPNDKHLAVLRYGLARYPHDTQTRKNLKRLYLEAERFEDAAKLDTDK